MPRFLGLISIDLLHGSETFLGLLATIVIFFIFAEERSNFIYLLLTEVKNKIIGQIKELSKFTGVLEIFDSPSYKALYFYLKDIENEKNSEYEEGNKLLNDILLRRQDLQYDYLPVGNYETVLGDITEAKEHMLAPLYTVFFCLNIFIFDELLDTSISFISNRFLLYSLIVFICLSFVFWVFLWITFIVNVNYYISNIEYVNNDELGKNEQANKRGVFAKLRSYYSEKLVSITKKSVYHAYIIRTILLILSVIFFLWIASYISFSVESFLVAIVLPIIILGFIRIRIREKRGKYTYLFMCGHFVAIVLTSLLFSFIIILFTDFYDYNLYDMVYNNLGWIKVSILLFVILNGVLFPFVIPYFAYNQLYKDSKKKSKVSLEKSRNLISELENKLDVFCKTKIKPTNPPA